jgi:predicted aspartyl protease
MRVSFPLGYRYDTDLGVVPEAVIPVFILTKGGSYESYDFIVDTGADCCIVPRSIAEDLGIDIKSLPSTTFKGIEGGPLVAYLTKITIKITNIPVEVTCAVSSNEKSPFVLGRLDVFDKFNILFNNQTKQITFIEIR